MPASAELFTVRTPGDAWALLVAHIHPITRVEDIDTARALGRVLATDLVSSEDLPAFRRSTVDGYAVIAYDTHGATPGLPALLSVAGEAPMGQIVDTPIALGQAVWVHTGSMIPPDADAVVMVEHTQPVSSGPAPMDLPEAGIPAAIEVMRPVAEGENILQVGEDARAGGIVARRGHCLRPADIGAMMALGNTRVTVMARPRVGILSTGDEVIPPEQVPGIGQVRDVNAYALSALVEQAGGEAVRYGIIPDDRAALERAAGQARRECDAVILSAGSSVSYRDMSLEVIQGLGGPGVLVHGVSVKPGKPTILAMADGVPVFGLPGNPASAMVVAELFVVPTVRALLGAAVAPRASVLARLARNVASTTGREDFVPVRLETRADGLWAIPVFGKSNLIVTLLRADGTLRVAQDENGLQAGAWVTVNL